MSDIAPLKGGRVESPKSEKSIAHRIRPAGRHILTIGRDLIRDRHAAIIELVKNSYDADSPEVEISISAHDGNFTVTVSDKGHGMTTEDVVSCWLVPSTDNKLKRKVSPGGRIMQGNKGVGRYAAAMLGEELFLETVTEEGIMTRVLVEWMQFERAEFLDDVEILVESVKTSESKGTRLTMSSADNQDAVWTKDQVKELRSELRKLVSPVSFTADRVKVSKEFSIWLSVEGILSESDFSIEVEPYPVIDVYAYRISGIVEADGRGKLTYQNQVRTHEENEVISFDAGHPTGCGQLEFDIRVYDREPLAISEMIERGLKDESGESLGKREAKRLLDAHCGIGVYRNGFRLRPLGDSEFDWLQLNSRRVQNPSKCVGVDQVIGYVFIKSEDESGLIEKSARDGLKANDAYKGLQAVTKKVISELETRRSAYRVESGASRPRRDISKAIESLYSTDKLIANVEKELAALDACDDVINRTVQLIEKDASGKRELTLSISQAMIVYQRYSSLGKIVETILHEAKRPIGHLVNQAKNMEYWSNQYSETEDADAQSKVVNLAKNLAKQSRILSSWFVKLDPLFVVENLSRQELNLIEELDTMFSFFNESLQAQGVSYEVLCESDPTVYWWPQDLYAVFTNLIENSLYWMRESSKKGGKICITFEARRGKILSLTYRDNGPGIDPKYIESEVIFELEFSGKRDEDGSVGTGLGLTIAREAAYRNGYLLNAAKSDDGAVFYLEQK